MKTIKDLSDEDLKHYLILRSRIKAPTDNSKRKALIDQYGYDVKFAVHVVRLLLQVEQILIEGDLDLEKNSKILKSVRYGEWTLEQVESFFKDNEKRLMDIYDKSTIAYAPPKDKIKALLLNCLETHFGSLSDCVVSIDPAVEAIDRINMILSEYNRRSNV